MTFKKLGLLAAITLTFASTVSAQRISDRAQEAGKDYTPVSITSTNINMPQKVDGKVLVVDIFNYGCFHCKTLFPFTDEVYKKYGDKIELVKISAPFSQWMIYSQLFYALTDLGVEHKVAGDIFKAIHDERDRDLRPGNKALNKILEKHNISQADFEKAWNNPNIKTRINNNLEIMNQYKVTGTPVVIVNNEKIFTPALSKGYKQVATAVDTAIAQAIEKEKLNKSTNITNVK